MPQRPTRQRPPSQPRGRTRQQVPQRGPYPGQQQGPYAGYPGQQPPRQQLPPQQYPPRRGGAGYPGGYGERPQVRRGPGCGAMLLRLVLLALAIPLLLTLAGAVLGFGLLSGGGEDTSTPSAGPSSSSGPSPSAGPSSSAGPSPSADSSSSAGSSPSESAPSAATVSSAPTTVSSAPTPATTYPPARITGRECSRTGAGAYAATAAGNDRTSCAFAVAVQRAYAAAGGSGSTTTVTAYSQARGSDVRMLCTDDQPVRCVSSTGALVFLYGGEALVG